MPKRRIAVVGSGISGLNVAYYLIQRGFDVSVLTQGAKKRASDAAQGLICNKGLLLPKTSLFEAKIKSVFWVKEWLSDLEKRSGKEIEKDFNGVLEPFYDEESFSKIIRRIYKGEFWGLFGTKCQNSFYAPWASPHKGFLTYPHDGWFNISGALSALETFLSISNVSVTEVTVEKVFSKNKSIFIRGDEYLDSFDQVVFCAGYFNKELAMNSNIPYPATKPVWGQALTIKSDKNFGFYSLVSGTKSAIIRGKTSYLGSTSLKSEMPSNEEKSASKSELLNSLGTNFFAKELIQDCEINSSEGIRSMAKDRNPYWGGVSVEPWAGKVFFMGGMYKSGLQFSAFLARNLVRFICNEDVDILSSQFSLDRFRSKHS